VADYEIFEVVEVLEFETECGTQVQIEISRSGEQRTCIELHCPFHGEDQESLVWAARYTTPYPPQNFHINSRVAPFSERTIKELYFRHSIFSSPEYEDPHSFDHVFGIDCGLNGGWLADHMLRATPIFTNESEREPGIIASNVLTRINDGLDFDSFHYPYSSYGFISFTEDYKIEVYDVEAGRLETFFPQESNADLPPPWQTFISFMDINDDGHDDLYILTFPQIEGWGAVARVHLIYIWAINKDGYFL